MKTMPSFLTMTDAKDSVNNMSPVIITQMAADVPKPRNTKKIVIIAVSAVLAVAIILTAILVGMYLFTRGQKEILKYTLNVDKDTKQEVTIDPNENVNKYHVQNANYDMWVVDDFDRDIQVIKIRTSNSDTNCYVVPLNRTSTVDPSNIKTPLNIEAKHNATNRLIYGVSNTPIPDTSFLGKTAKETCRGISVYWMHPKCSDEGANRVQRRPAVWIHYEGACSVNGQAGYCIIDVFIS